MESLPARERGLKQSLANRLGACNESLPARERGLKLIGRGESNDSVNVAPRAGAWIETDIVRHLRLSVKSLPARERGLKLLLRQGMMFFLRRSPRGSVD